ncbi:MAG TPA: NAD(P)/FAD-dependent oxidoreductase [bacterium]|nr:NAD(P)/FAD-dependent oxidoreductase [bacterium]
MPAPKPQRIRGPKTDYDVVVVGAGSAGLSAALTLGRACRRVLVCDGGPPRNAPSPGVHSFLTRDGVLPDELLRIAREQLEPYDTVQVQARKVKAIEKRYDYFVVSHVDASEEGPATVETTRRVILCTGVVDELPALNGARELWGRGVLHCPYCHGWEVRGKPLAVYGRGKQGYGLGLLVSRWSPDVVLLTDGPSGITERGVQRLKAQGVRVCEDPIEQLVGKPNGELKHVKFRNGGALPRHALFLHAEQRQRSDLPEKLGCRMTQAGAVWTDKNGQTSVPGIYAAGDLDPGPQQAIIAAAEASWAAIKLNEALTKEECR